jgi:vacuolar-type H+-ATPase subunit F/Vma7
MNGPARIAAIGAARLVRGYGLAGVAVAVAEDDEAARDAWRALEPEITLVVVTASAAKAIAAAGGPGNRLLAVLPEPGGLP